MQYQQRRDKYITTIDFMFYNEGKIKRAVRVKRLDTGTHKGKASAGRSGYISDPTAATALRELTPVRIVYVDTHKIVNPEKWLRVISATYDHLSELQAKIIRARYRGENYQQTCDTLHISHATYSRTLHETRMFAAAIAAQFGLVEIVPLGKDK